MAKNSNFKEIRELVFRNERISKEVPEMLELIHELAQGILLPECDCRKCISVRKAKALLSRIEGETS